MRHARRYANVVVSAPIASLLTRLLILLLLLLFRHAAACLALRHAAAFHAVSLFDATTFRLPI